VSQDAQGILVRDDACVSKSCSGMRLKARARSRFLQEVFETITVHEDLRPKTAYMVFSDMWRDTVYALRGTILRRSAMSKIL